MRSSRMARFRDLVEARIGRPLSAYTDLWQWSIDDLEGFWLAVAEYFEIAPIIGSDMVMTSEDMPGTRWFPGRTLNYAEYVLARGESDDVAIVGLDESSGEQSLTWGQLRHAVARVAAMYRESGVCPGDRVVGYVPNIPEAVVAMLAATSIGAIWSSVGMDYAAAAAVDRIGALEPTVLVHATSYRYGGKVHDRRTEVAKIAAAIPSLRCAVEIQRAGLASPPLTIQSRTWEDVVGDSLASKELADLEFEPTEFNDPLWVLFSSGTTGRPKGIVQSHGGVLVGLLAFLGLHMDLGPGDRFFWYTSPSWVMWNINASALGAGASIVCYDGSPTFPHPGILFEQVARCNVTAFGSSPGYLDAVRSTEVVPMDEWSLVQLRTLATTGSPISPVTHEWATRACGDLPVHSASGGTDVCGALAGGAPLVAVWPGELSVRLLGVALEAWSDDGDPVVGEVGELVLTRPFPSMPIYFWNDPTGQNYKDAYFDTYPGIWRHGDWITVTERGSVVMHGRSDSTLNRHGVRMGSADIYNALSELPGLADTLVLGVEDPNGGYWMPLFVEMAEGTELTDELKERIASILRTHVSPRHVPDEVIEVAGIPRTRTGKRLEVPLKKLMQGADPAKVIQTSALGNPRMVDRFIEIARERAVTE